MDRKRTIRYFAVMFFLFTAGNGFWNYASVYFREIGFDSIQLGLMTAVGNCVAMVALPFMGVLSDKLRSPRLVLAVIIGVSAVLHLLFPVVGALWGAVLLPTLILSVLGTLGRQGGNAMLESWIGGEMDRLGASFGTIRRYGSGAFVVASLVGSIFIGKVLPYWTCFLFITLMTLPILWMSVSETGRQFNESKSKERTVRTRDVMEYVFKNYYFVCYLLLVMAFDSFLGILGLDMTYIMDYVGTARSNVGYVGVVRASTEIVIFILIGKAKKLPPLWMLLTVSGALIAGEHLLYPGMDSLWDMLAVTLLSGVAGGFFYGIGANYVFKIVDHRAASTAMSVLGVVKALIGIIGNGVGGVIIDRFGVITLTTAVGIIAASLTVLFLVTCLLGRFVWKIPYVSEKEKTA